MPHHEGSQPRSAYEFRGNFYCPGDAVWVLVCTPEFTGYEAAGGRLGYTEAEEAHGREGRIDTLATYTPQMAEADLNLLAAWFDVDRSRAMPWEFPMALHGTPEPPSFCSECLEWFDPLPHDFEEGSTE